MNVKEKIEELREASEDGTITAAQVTEAGLHRSVLQKFVKSGEIYRFGRGLYVWSDVWEDDFYLFTAKVWARNLFARYCFVSAGLFGSYPGKIYDDLSQRLQCFILETGKSNCQARCAGEL